VGILRYAGTPYTVADSVLGELSHVAALALAAGRTFGVELQRPDRTIQLVLSPGVPLAFEIDNGDPDMPDSDVIDRWTQVAVGGGWIEILD
jgi:hypothetical protein